MRTTLDISDDVLLAAKEVAQREKRSAGAVVSEWARTALVWRSGAQPASAHKVASPGPLARYGIQPLPVPRGKGVLVTNALIDRLRDEDGI